MLSDEICIALSVGIVKKEEKLITKRNGRISALKDMAELIAAYAKWGAVSVGGFCLMIYSVEIGQFPEGLNLGEGLAFYLVCAGFWIVYTLYAVVTTAMGSLLMAGPALVYQKYTRRRSGARHEANVPTDYSPMWEVPTISLGFVGFVIWFFYVFYHPLDGAIFMALPLAQGFLVAILLTMRRRLRLFHSGINFRVKMR